MSTGLKIWLWIILVLNAIGAVLSAFAMLIAPISALAVVMEIVLIAGIVLLLFKQKKLGFYIMVGCSAAGLIINIMLAQGLLRSIFSAIIAPGITYLLMRNSWNEFE
jgi:hypothetical protein